MIGLMFNGQWVKAISFGQNDLVSGLMFWANDWVYELIGRVGASYGYVSKQTRVSKPDSRIYEQKSEGTKMRGGGMTTYPYIYIHVYIYNTYMTQHRYIHIYIYILIYMIHYVYRYAYKFVYNVCLHQELQAAAGTERPSPGGPIPCHPLGSLRHP